MGLFSKKKGKKKKEDKEKEGLPPLPSDDSTKPPYTGKSKELPPLPSFPSSDTGNRVSNHAAKQAIEKPREQAQPQQPEGPSKAEEISPPKKREKRTQEIGLGQIKSPTQQSSEGPVYVRLDDFEDSQKKFDKVRKMVQEIDKDLKEEIKELKDKEEKEIQEWEKEIKKAKSLLQKIDSSIYSKSK